MKDVDVSTFVLDTEIRLREDIENQPAALQFLSGEKKGNVIRLDKEIMTGGRLPENEIHFADGLLSRRHFQIIHDGASYYLRDVRSTNGTYLNERKLESDSVLINGDVIRIGTTRLKFYSGNDPECARLLRSSQESIMDELTGCFTKSHLNSHLNRAFKKASIEETPLSLLVFEVDNVEEDCKQYGPQARDFILSRSIRRIKNRGIRSDDILARYSDLEFILLLEGSTLKRAKQIAARLLGLFDNKPFHYQNELLRPTLSIGVADFQPAMRNGAELFERADYALYESKKHGGDRSTAYGVSTFEGTVDKDTDLELRQ